MICCVCEAPAATVHRTQLLNGVRTTHDYCQNCAPGDIGPTLQQILSGTFDPEAHWIARWERLHAEHPQFAGDAYRFVEKSIHRRYESQSQQGSKNFSTLLESCQAYAKELYGESAKAQLKAWGIETFLDVAEIILLRGPGGIKGRLDPALEERVEKMHEKMRENLRQKYGLAPFLSDQA